MTREEAVKMLKSKMDGHTDTSYEWAETVRMAIKALEQEPSEDMTTAYLIGYYADKEPCEDAISRQAALDCFTATKLKKFDFILYAREEIKKLPSVKPQVICPSHGVDCEDCPAYEPKTDVLDKIRAEISALPEDMGNVINTHTGEIVDRFISSRKVLRIIDKYKSESEDKHISGKENK